MYLRIYYQGHDEPVVLPVFKKYKQKLYSAIEKGIQTHSVIELEAKWLRGTRVPYYLASSCIRGYCITGLVD